MRDQIPNNYQLSMTKSNMCDKNHFGNLILEFICHLVFDIWNLVCSVFARDELTMLIKMKLIFL